MKKKLATFHCTAALLGDPYDNGLVEIFGEYNSSPITSSKQPDFLHCSGPGGQKEQFHHLAKNAKVELAKQKQELAEKSGHGPTRFQVSTSVKA